MIQCDNLKQYAIQEINILLWFGLIGITAILFNKLIFLFKIWFYGSRIPGPPSPSFYGHSLLFSGDNPQLQLNGFLLFVLQFPKKSQLGVIYLSVGLWRDRYGKTSPIRKLLVKSHKIYGSMVKLWLSPTQLLVSIKEPSLINEMLSKAGDKIPLVGRVYRLAFGRSRFFVSSFEKVKKERERLSIELNGELLEKASSMNDRVVEHVMERITGIMETGTLDCGMFSQHIAFSILGAALFGDAFFAWSKANAYEELLLKIAKDACFWASYSVPPFWKLMTHYFRPF